VLEPITDGLVLRYIWLCHTRLLLKSSLRASEVVPSCTNDTA
jgi:hypothetical protein